MTGTLKINNYYYKNNVKNNEKCLRKAKKKFLNQVV